MVEVIDDRSARRTADAKIKHRESIAAIEQGPDDIGRNREDIEFRLALIDSRTLVRVAISYFLQSWAATRNGADNFLILPFSSYSEFLDQCPDPARDVDVVALNIGAASMGEERVQEDIRRLRDHLSDLPLVLMSDQVEPWSGLEALRQGIKGYIPTTLSPSVAIQAMRLVHAGGMFVPSDLLLYEEEQNKTPLKRPDATAPNGLTTRQQEVLDLIRLGKPNKLIAAELNISESTVKVYVRQVMKKLGAINRTHACYLLSRSAWDGETERRRAAG